MYSSSGDLNVVAASSPSCCAGFKFGGVRVPGVEGKLRLLKGDAGDDRVGVSLALMVSSSEKLMEIVGWANRPLLSRLMVLWLGRRGASVGDSGFGYSYQKSRLGLYRFIACLITLSEVSVYRCWVGMSRSVVTRWSSTIWQCRAGQVLSMD